MVNNLCEESNVLFALYCRCIAISTIVETGVAMILTLLVLHPQGMGTLYMYRDSWKFTEMPIDANIVFHSCLGRERWLNLLIAPCLYKIQFYQLFTFPLYFQDHWLSTRALWNQSQTFTRYFSILHWTMYTPSTVFMRWSTLCEYNALSLSLSLFPPHPTCTHTHTCTHSYSSLKSSTCTNT